MPKRLWIGVGGDTVGFMGTGVWENIERIAKSPTCVVCGEETNLNRKGKFDLCKKHNSWMTYFFLRFRSSSEA
jgi:hypothetical protein